MTRGVGALLLCAFAGCATMAGSASAPGFIVYSQHRANDGSFWYRTEAGPMPKAECRATLKRVTTQAKVRFSKWYDASTVVLAQHFGQAAVPTFGSWVGCWPAGTDLAEPEE